MSLTPDEITSYLEYQEKLQLFLGGLKCSEIESHDEGLKEGHKETLIFIVERMLNKKLSHEEISKYINLNIEKINEITLLQTKNMNENFVYDLLAPKLQKTYNNFLTKFSGDRAAVEYSIITGLNMGRQDARNNLLSIIVKNMIRLGNTKEFASEITELGIKEIDNMLNY